MSKTLTINTPDGQTVLTGADLEKLKKQAQQLAASEGMGKIHWSSKSGWVKGQDGSYEVGKIL